jgi:hypothetical protein
MEYLYDEINLPLRLQDRTTGLLAPQQGSRNIIAVALLPGPNTIHHSSLKPIREPSRFTAGSTSTPHQQRLIRTSRYGSPKGKLSLETC